MTCLQCGVCCKLFMINLSKEEYLSGRYETIFDEFPLDTFEEAELTGGNLLKQKEDGSCIYLKDDKCSIHKNKPESCRKFCCDSKEEKYKDMIKKISQSSQSQC